MNPILLVTVVLIGLASSQSIFGTNQYIELEPGNINILLTVPHNGHLSPENLPNRTQESPVDSNTRKIAEVFRDELSSILSPKLGYTVKPFIVYNNLRRYKLDPNRDSTICCSGNDQVLKAYNEFFSFIKQNFAQDFVKSSNKSYKQALILDIHGQGHPENRIEIGYGLSIRELNKDKIGENVVTSVGTINRFESNKVDDLIRGNVSFGAMLNKYGLKAIPSPNDPKPLDTNYFNGGYITNTLSALSNPNSILNVIQCEFPYSMRSNTTSIQSTMKKFAPAVVDFYNLHSLGL